MVPQQQHESGKGQICVAGLGPIELGLPLSEATRRAVLGAPKGALSSQQPPPEVQWSPAERQLRDLVKRASGLAPPPELGGNTAFDAPDDVIRATPNLGRDAEFMEPVVSDCELSQGYVYRYREVEVCFPREWMHRYLVEYTHLLGEGADASTEMISSVPDTLRVFWPNFRFEDSPSNATADSLIECYQVPERFEKGEYLFWFGSGGAPREFIRLAIRAIATESELARDAHPTVPGGSLTATSYCDGFEMFLHEPVLFIPGPHPV